MTPSEAAQLLGHCAAFDNRTVGTSDARAWAAALHDMPLDDDTLAAVARFYGTPADKPSDRLWIQPHNVRAHRAAIRRERLGDTLPAYEPPPESETGAEFVARRRAQLEAVAAGRLAAKPIGCLTGGPAPEVAKRLKGIGREVPSVDKEEPDPGVKRPGPLGVKCPKCRAAIGRPCRTPGGKERPVHPARVATFKGEPLATESDDEIARRREASRRHLAQMPESADETAGSAS